MGEGHFKFKLGIIVLPYSNKTTRTSQEKNKTKQKNIGHGDMAHLLPSSGNTED